MLGSLGYAEETTTLALGLQDTMTPHLITLRN